MTKDNKKLTIIISIVVLLVLVANVAFAFFASNKELDNLNAQVATGAGEYIFTVVTGNDINYNIEYEDMQENTISNSIAVINNNTTLNVSLSSSKEGQNVTCSYDIIWTWDTSNGYSQYTSSSMGVLPKTYYTDGNNHYSETEDETFNTPVAFDKEYAVGIKLNNSDVLPLQDFSKLNTTSGITTLKQNLSISSDSITPTTDSYTINTSIYNLPISQSSILGKNFKGEVSVDNVECEISDKEEPQIEVLSGDGTNVGDKIAIGDQNFYVISNDGTNIEMLAEYNLKVGYKNGYNSTTRAQGEFTSSDEGYGLQSAEAKGYGSSGNTYVGTLAFSNSAYWTYTSGTPYIYNNQSNLYQYVENYVSYLNSEYNAEATGKLMSYEQAIALGCTKSGYTCKNTGVPSWVYSTSYWLGSAYSNAHVWGVGSSGDFDIGYYDYGDGFGARPVIKISASSVS